MTDAAGRLSPQEREVLTSTLELHRPGHDGIGCTCGWDEPTDHTEHVVGVYQLALVGRRMGLDGG